MVTRFCSTWGVLVRGGSSLFRTTSPSVVERWTTRSPTADELAPCGLSTRISSWVGNLICVDPMTLWAACSGIPLVDM